METRGRKAYIQRNYLRDEYVQKWLVGLAEKTKRNYIFAFKDWLDFVVMTPTEQIQKRIQDTISPDLTQRFFFESKWREYKAFMEEKGTLSDASIKAYLKTVASFFARNSLPLVLKRGDWETTQTQRAIRQRWTPTNEEIRKMYSHANLRDRALLLCLYQSGLSEIDAVNLRIEDLMGLYDCPEGEHFFIEKPREKTGNIQSTCLSFECVHDIKALLQEMGNPQEGFIFVSTTIQTGTRLKVRAVHEAIRGLVERAFGEERVQEFKTKSLRSSYNSALLRANIQPQELKDAMMGHKRRGARANYDYDEPTIKESYERTFQFLTINGIQNRKDIQDLRTTQLTQAKLLSQIGEENEKQKAEIEGQKQEIELLKTNYEKLEHMLELVAKGEFEVTVETQEEIRKRKQKEAEEN
ncbi:MAG: site-specific integrase [Candidatus Bathyarchaeota archaeon]|nr:site-specific integrase [Candidatus Bathyarchaeum sp.]